jgi:hypothetical protein
MGIEPVDEDIPLDINDFPALVQTSFIIYDILADVWEGMSGTYCGKNYTIVFELFDIYDIETQQEKLMCMDFLRTMDATRGGIIKDKNKNPAK